MIATGTKGRAGPEVRPSAGGELPWRDGQWRELLRDAVRDGTELLGLLGLGTADGGFSAAAARDFALRVPRGFVARMRPGDPGDPLLRQVLPLVAELEPTPGFDRDPLRESAAAPVAGVLHKYRGRALLVATGACAVHCRYCFRRHFPYGDRSLLGDGESALRYLESDPDLEEVILSGGDPLSLSDRALGRLSRRLAGLPGLRRLRLHSRTPVVLPERIDGSLLAWLERLPCALVLVIHANHPAEIDERVAAALAALRRRGVVLLNQSVLLRGVNDDVEVLAALSRRLFEIGVLPYYLHRLDPVAGAAHFRVADERARAIAAELWRRLPGYLVPRYVAELPGAPSKVPIDLALDDLARTASLG